MNSTTGTPYLRGITVNAVPISTAVYRRYRGIPAIPITVKTSSLSVMPVSRYNDSLSLQAWDEEHHPWMNVALIQLTTFIPCRALRRTCFNIIQKPRCLRFRAAKSPTDPHSYHSAWSAVHTELEVSHTSQMTDDYDDCCSEAETSTHNVPAAKKHIVTVCTAPIKDGGTVPRVDVYVTFTGQYTLRMR